MKKTAALLSLLLCVSLLLSGCAREQVVYQEVSVAQPTAVRQADILNTATDAPAPVISFPEAEEEPEQPEPISYYNYGQQAAQPVEQSRYAGSTPIPLDPVDMPTPTPRPDIEFEYEKMDTALGYSMDVPVGWLVEQNDKNMFVIRDPEMRDNVYATFTMTTKSVSSSYRASDLKAELSEQLSQIQRNYVGWKIWQADSRPLLKSDGVYNAYRGVTYDDTVVRGLVHVALVNRNVVTLSFSAPGYYNTSYQRVYNKMRNTNE